MVRLQAETSLCVACMPWTTAVTQVCRKHHHPWVESGPHSLEGSKLLPGKWVLPCQCSSVTSVDGSGCLTSWGQLPMEGVLVEGGGDLEARAQRCECCCPCVAGVCVDEWRTWCQTIWGHGDTCRVRTGSCREICLRIDSRPGVICSNRGLLLPVTLPLL